MTRVETLNVMNQKELSAMSPPYRYDAFISYASEDDEVARELAEELTNLGMDVWYAEFSLHYGDSLSASIDKGLAESEYGIIILSRKFFEKGWTMQELGALLTKQANLNKRIIFPIWHNISRAEIQAQSPMLADTVAAKSSEGIPKIAKKLNSQIRGKESPDFSSDISLKEGISKLFKFVEDQESLLNEAKEQILTAILTKTYLVTGGYRNVFVYFIPFSDLLCSNEKEKDRLGKFIDVLMGQNLVMSKALATFSITHQGIKKIESLIESSFQTDPNKAHLNFMKSISKVEIQAIFNIQKSRYDILKKTYEMFNEGIETVNIHQIGQLLGIQKEDLNRLYFYLEDEGLIEFYALGGSFSITDKGKEFIENTTSNRIH